MQKESGLPLDQLVEAGHYVIDGQEYIYDGRDNNGGEKGYHLFESVGAAGTEKKELVIHDGDPVPVIQVVREQKSEHPAPVGDNAGVDTVLTGEAVKARRNHEKDFRRYVCRGPESDDAIFQYGITTISKRYQGGGTRFSQSHEAHYPALTRVLKALSGKVTVLDATIVLTLGMIQDAQFRFPNFVRSLKTNEAHPYTKTLEIAKNAFVNALSVPYDEGQAGERSLNNNYLRGLMNDKLGLTYAEIKSFVKKPNSFVAAAQKDSGETAAPAAQEPKPAAVLLVPAQSPVTVEPTSAPKPVSMGSQTVVGDHSRLSQVFEQESVLVPPYSVEKIILEFAKDKVGSPLALQVLSAMSLRKPEHRAGSFAELVAITDQDTFVLESVFDRAVRMVKVAANDQGLSLIRDYNFDSKNAPAA